MEDPRLMRFVETAAYKRELREAVDAVPAWAWRRFENQQILITGGTGFIGCWVMGVILEACRRYHIAHSIIVISRNPNQHRQERPDLFQHPSVQMLQADLSSDDNTWAKQLSGVNAPNYILHAAGDVHKANNTDTCRAIVDGTGTLIDLYSQSPASLHSFVLVSSKAAENPSAPLNYYGAAKFEAERIAMEAYNRGLPARCIRLWAQIGPGMPLDTHFAAGNFVRAVLKGEKPQLTGDAFAKRRWNHVADTAAALCRTLLCPEHSPFAQEAYGSEEITIAEMARIVESINATGRWCMKYLHTSYIVSRTLQHYRKVLTPPSPQCSTTYRRSQPNA